MDLERQVSSGRWLPTSPEHLAWYLDGAIAIERMIAGNLEREITFDTHEGALALLEQGKTLKYGQDWYESVRRSPKRAMRAPVVRKPDTRTRVTCKICGQIDILPPPYGGGFP